jgi:hypothetical protein
MDIQASFEVNSNFKSGIRFRNNREDGDSYTWSYSDDTEINGQYNPNPWYQEKMGTDLWRAYSKVRFWRIGELDAGLLFFLQYAKDANRYVSRTVESEPLLTKNEKEFAIEANPFVNYKFQGGYVDVGILLEYAYMGMRNFHSRWNPVSQSEQKNVLRDTEPYYGWSQTWENFSQGSQWFIATGFETYASIDVYKKLSLLGRIMVLKQYTTVTKEYGSSQIPEGEMGYAFVKSHERADFRNETWMTGTFGLQYRVGPMDFYWTVDLPLSYLSRLETRLKKESQLEFEHSMLNVWQVQQPTTMRLFMMFALIP